MEDATEVIFRPLRPYCMALTTQPSLPVLNKLNDVVLNSDQATLEGLQEYIMLPMQIYLKAPTMPENYTLSVLNFVRDLYARVKLTSKFILMDLLQNMLIMLTPEELEATSNKTAQNKKRKMTL